MAQILPPRSTPLLPDTITRPMVLISGKLEVDGSVYVIGSIYSGGCIKATGDIIIEHNVEMGRLIAGGNVMMQSFHPRPPFQRPLY